MGAANMVQIAAELIAHGMPADLPVLAVSQATTPRERRLRADLAGIAGALRDNPMPAPVLFLIGHVAALAEDERRMICALPHRSRAAAQAGLAWLGWPPFAAGRGACPPATAPAPARSRPTAPTSCAIWSGRIAARATGCG
jgi:hypothetical protein